METSEHIEQLEDRMAQIEVEVGLGGHLAEPASSDPEQMATLGRRILGKLEVLTREVHTLGSWTHLYSKDGSTIRAGVDTACFQLGAIQESQGQVLQLLKQHSDALTEIREELSELRHTA